MTRRTKKKARAQEKNGPAPDHSQAGCVRRRSRTNWLQCETEYKVDAREHRIAQVIHAVYLDHINVLRIKPVAGPRVNESERIAPVLEAAIAVVRLADTKP